ncbi:MAG: SirA family protein [Chloroflexi bacterium]|nr:SirA family protein [Chloroflexota bacterium]
MTIIDTRGLSCPQPVLLVRKAIEAGQKPLQVLTDSATARDNVRRLAERLGLSVTITEANDEFTMTLE